MLRDDPNFRRIPVRARSLLGNASYWLAADHLLVVEVSGVTERYRRFELQDLQAVMVIPAPNRLVWNLILGALSVLAALVTLMVSVDAFGPNSSVGDMLAFVVLASGTLALLAALLVNSLRGPGGRLVVKTAVQTLPLPGIGRWRQAERLLGALTAAARAAQFLTSTPETQNTGSSEITAAPGTVSSEATP